MALSWRTVGLLLIAVVGLLLLANWIFGGSGIFSGVKEAVESVIKFGAEEKNATKPSIPEKQESTINKLVDTIKQMIDSSGNNCFMNYGGLSGLELGIQIDLEKDYIKVSKDGRILVDLTNQLRKEITGFEPCVIGGETNGQEISENFYDTFLKSSTEVKIPNFLSVTKISIQSQKISFGGGGFVDFESQGWLYKNKEGGICFFPTHTTRNGPYGLNNDYFNQDEEEGIYHRINQGLLKLCSSENEWLKYKSIELSDYGTLPQKTIAQTCKGLIGKDCPTQIGKWFGKLPTQDAKTGCWVMITKKNTWPITNEYAQGEAQIGQILYPADRAFESPGNIKMITGTLSGNEDAKKLLNNNVWNSFQDRSLICSEDKFWYACTADKIGKSLTINNKKYTCKTDNRKLAWMEAK